MTEDWVHGRAARNGAQYVAAVGAQQSARLSAHHPEEQWRVRIRPDAYIWVTNREWGDTERELNRNTIDRLKERMIRHEPLDAVFFDMDNSTTRMVSQEGRHRAVAARELGIPDIPLIVWGREPWYAYPSEEVRTLFKERWGVHRLRHHPDAQTARRNRR